MERFRTVKIKKKYKKKGKLWSKILWKREKFLKLESKICLSEETNQTFVSVLCK